MINRQLRYLSGRFILHNHIDSVVARFVKLLTELYVSVDFIMPIPILFMTGKDVSELS